MSRIGDLIEMGLIGKMLIQKPMHRGFLWRIAGIVILSVITGMMLFAVLLGAIFLIYHALISDGVTPEHALWVTGAVFVCLTLVFALCTAFSIYRMRDNFSFLSSNSRKIVTAFVDGLSKKKN